MNFILDDLDVKIAEFKSHKFELEKEYRHHMSLPIISEYLEFVFKEKGLKSAIQLFDFIITVQVLQHCTKLEMDGTKILTFRLNISTC